MKTDRILRICLFLTAASIFGCKSNPTTPTGGIPSITITPSTLQGSDFVSYTFTAKIENHDFAQTYFKWDLGDSTKTSPRFPYTGSYEVTHAYMKPGKYSVTVTGYDIYTDSMIATKIMQIEIDTARTTVEIIPQFYTGSLDMDGRGHLPCFALSVKTSIASSALHYFWDFGDGTNDSTSGVSTCHVFPQVGKYIAKADVYDQNGVFEGSDTAAITINFHDVTLSTIQQMNKVEAYLYPDSTYKPFPKVFISSQIFSLGIPMPNYSGNTFIWNGTDFSASYFHDSLIFGSSAAKEQIDFRISGTLSSDGKTVNSVSFFAKDSVYNTVNNNKFIEAGFSAGNMKLLSVTKNRIVFIVSGSDLKSSFHNAICNSNNLIFGAAENFSIFIDTNHPVDPQCILVFSKP